MASNVISSKINPTATPFLHQYQSNRNNSSIIPKSHPFLPSNPKISTNFNPKNPIFTLKRSSSMNGYPFRFLNEEEGLEFEAKRTATNLIRSGKGVIELLSILRIPTLMAIAILTRIAIANGKPFTALLPLLGLQMYWSLEFLWSILPSEKSYILSAPQVFFEALVKPLEELVDCFDGEIKNVNEFSGFALATLVKEVVEEVVVVGYIIMKIVKGNAYKVTNLRKKHEWVDSVGFLFASTVLTYITKGVALA